MRSDELPLPLRIWKLLPEAQSHLESWQGTAMVSKCLQLWRNPIRKKATLRNSHHSVLQVQAGSKSSLLIQRLKQECRVFISLRGVLNFQSPDTKSHRHVPVSAFLGRLQVPLGASRGICPAD